MSVADEERAAFERYMSSDVGPADLKRAPLCGHYESMWTRGAWFGWVARSLEIDALRDSLAAATERGEAAERTVGRLRDQLDAIDAMVPPKVTRHTADTDEKVDDLAAAYHATNARADALAARLAEVDGEIGR